MGVKRVKSAKSSQKNSNRRGNEIDHFTMRNCLPNGFQSGSVEFRIQIESGYVANSVEERLPGRRGVSLAERGLHADHVTVWRWVQRYAPEMERRLRSRLRPTNDSWRVDETYIRVKGKWVYLYRAVDSSGATIDFLLSAKRDAAAAERFLAKALGGTGALRDSATALTDRTKMTPEPGRRRAGAKARARASGPKKFTSMTSRSVASVTSLSRGRWQVTPALQTSRSTSGCSLRHRGDLGRVGDVGPGRHDAGRIPRTGAATRPHVRRPPRSPPVQAQRGTDECRADPAIGPGDQHLPSGQIHCLPPNTRAPWFAAGGPWFAARSIVRFLGVTGADAPLVVTSVSYAPISRLIRALRLIWGIPVPQINRRTGINRGNVTGGAGDPGTAVRLTRGRRCD